jgi:single-strand DNA-binding protein
MAEITVYGNLGRTPELRHTQSGAAVLSLSLAENRKDKDGKELGTDWFDVVLWNQDAEW